MNNPKPNIEEFPIMVSRLAKSGTAILAELKPQQYGMLVGLAYSLLAVSDSLDKAKKVAIYQKDPDKIEHNMTYAMAEMASEHHQDEFEKAISVLTPEKAALLHAAVGIVGEAAELMEAILGYLGPKDALDLENVREELGDLEFYMQDLRDKLQISREQVIEQNMAKLAERYQGYKYSNEAAQARADKQTEENKPEIV